MNNEETIINQSNEFGKEDVQKKNNTSKIAIAGASAIGGAALGGGVGAFAANVINGTADEAEPEVKVEEEVKVETVEPQPAPARNAEPARQEETVEENSSTETNTDQESTNNSQETDYTNNNSANPITGSGNTPINNDGETPIHTSGGDDEPEVQVLGVYENEEGAELALITDGETIAAVLDSDGDGEADILAVDENHNNHFDEGEVHDISDQHISMEPLEQEYLAQQQQEAEQNDTFAYQAQDETDYDNNADVYEA